MTGRNGTDLVGRLGQNFATGGEPAADYVVYLQNPREKQKSARISWKSYRSQLKNDGLTLATTRLATTKDGVLLVEFQVASGSRQKLNPEWIWLTQNRNTRPIHGLMLSSQEVDARKPISGVMQILRNDVSETDPLRIELRRKRSSFLSLPKVNAWK